jgi:hypothetical protein
MMRIGYIQSCACLSSCCEFATQALAATVIRLNAVRCDPDAFQKACIVVRSVIQGVNFYCHTHYLPQLIRILNLAETFDFYGFFRLPRYFLHPYAPDRLDEYAILNELKIVLFNNWNSNFGVVQQHDVDQFAENQLKVFLEQMVENSEDLRTDEEVRILLSNSLRQTLEASPKKGCDPQNINLSSLKIPLKKACWLDVLTNATFIVVDIACVPAFLRDWSLIDLARYANQLGRFPLLSWVPSQKLDDWIWMTMCTGYILKFSQAAYRLWQEKLIPKEAKDAKWIMIASLAECLYCLAILQKKDPRLIIFLAFSAKSLGLLRFLLAPKPSFFTINQDVV